MHTDTHNMFLPIYARRHALDKELRTAIEKTGKFAKQHLSSVKEQIDVEIKATKAGAKTTAEQVVQIQSDVLKLGASANALSADGQKLKQEAALACGTVGLHYLCLLSVFSIYLESLFLSIYAYGHTQHVSIYLCTQTHTTYTYSRRSRGQIKSSLSALEALSETLSAGLKDVAQLKQKMTSTRARMRDGSEAKVLKDKLTELQGKVQSVGEETSGSDITGLTCPGRSCLFRKEQNQGARGGCSHQRRWG
jgi:uncharacterized phage infection (PIP) family protein YhgE